MNKISFLIPTFPPHYKYTRQLYKSFMRNNLLEQADFWLVFTDEKEKSLYGEYNNCIVLDQRLRNFENRGIINIKKLYGLNQLYKTYEYVITLDAESLFIRNIDIYHMCTTFFENRILYGNTQPPEGIRRTKPIKEHAARFFIFNSDQAEKINKFYLWFNQPCIYKSEHINDFFSAINYTENAAKYGWYDFDYYLYMYFLIAKKQFVTRDIGIESNYGICEAGLDYLYFRNNDYEQIPIYMCSQATLNIFDNHNLFILCHLDRDNVWMQRVTNMKIDSLSQEIMHIRSRIESLEQRNIISWMKSVLRRFL